MRVLMIGNVNNEPYRLAHEISRLGHSVQLVLTTRTLLDEPDQLGTLAYYANSPVRVNRDLSHFTTWEWMYPSRILKRRLLSLSRESDVIIGNSVGLSTLPFLERPYAAFVTGSDVTVYATAAFAEAFSVKGRRTRWATRMRGRSPDRVTSDFVRRQQLGVNRARLLVTLPKGASRSLEFALEGLGADGIPRYLWSPFTPSQGPSRVRLNWHDGLGLRVLVGSRLTRRSTDIWERSDLDDKGSQVIVNGWAQALASGFKGQLVLFDKGYGVNEVKASLEALGVEDSISWESQTNLPAFLHQISSSDVVVDSLGGAPPGRVTIDALAAGKPVITRISAAEQASRFGTIFPQILPAANAEEFCDALLRIQSSGTDFARAPQAMTLVQRIFSPQGNAGPIIAELERVSRL